MVNKALVALSCVAAALSANAEVVVADGSNFDEVKGQSDFVMMEFYAPWCGHCKKLEPEYNDAAAQLADDERFTLAKIDCTGDDNRDSCSQFGVTGYPTIKIFQKDVKEPSPYEGGRNADSIVKYLKKQTQPAFVEISTQEELDEFKGKNLAIAAALTGDEKDAFVAAANKLKNDDYLFAVVDESLQSDKIVMYHTFDEGKTVFSGEEITEESVADFALHSSFPLIGEIGPENYQKYMTRGLPLFWLFVDPKDETATVEAATAAAPDFAKKLSFVKLDGVKWEQHAKSMGVTSTPGLVISEGRKNFVFDKDATSADDIKAFSAGVLDGTIKAHLKSQDVPEQDPDSNVVTLVGKNFEEVVFESGKDVFVEFYAPWCGHCKNLAPKWELLADEFAHADNIIVAKVDSTENDTPAEIQGFPTLVYYPAGNKEGLKYEGGREVEPMAEYIRKHASSEVPEKPSHDEL